MTEPLLFRVDDPAMLPDLVEFLGNTVYGITQVDESSVEVEPPGELDRAIVEAELGVYLRMWERENPGASALIAG